MNNKEDKRLLSYEDQKCFICGQANTVSIFVSLPKKQLIMCVYCSDELYDVLKKSPLEKSR